MFTDGVKQYAYLLALVPFGKAGAGHENAACAEVANGCAVACLGAVILWQWQYAVFVFHIAKTGYFRNGRYIKQASALRERFKSVVGTWSYADKAVVVKQNVLSVNVKLRCVAVDLRPAVGVKGKRKSVLFILAYYALACGNKVQIEIGGIRKQAVGVRNQLPFLLENQR